MKKIVLRNDKNKKITPDLVRFFKYQNDYYLIYTFHEKDEKDFIKLYVIKIMEELGKPVIGYLTSDWEWDQMQEIVKQMLRELKKNQIVSFKDVDAEILYGLKISQARSFKLLKSLVDILSGNNMIPPKQEEIISSSVKSRQPIANSRLEKNEQNKEEIVNKKDLLTTEIPSISKPIINNDICTIEPIQEDKKNSSEAKKVLQESLENAVMTEIAYHKLQQENETLKKQLIQYQIKYQALKDLLTKDE